jgi:hypothetical protein
LEAAYVPANRRGKSGQRVAVQDLKRQVLASLAEGMAVRPAMAKVGRAEATYKDWRKTDKSFADDVDRLRGRMAGIIQENTATRDFPEFRLKYFGLETFEHQHQWLDVIEGKEPRNLDPAMTFVPGRRTRVLINTPPFHAKSATITIDYVVYRICMDPNIRVIIVSESRDMARKMLHAIKERLTHPKYEELHKDYGPAGGFKIGSSSWTQDLIYVGNKDPEQKDPTVEVLGIGSQIYGARADLIIMDDCATLKTARTAGQTEKIIQYIDQEVSSRLGPEGQLLLVGTRVTSADLYARFLKRDQDKNEAHKRVWSYLAQPAVLEYNDDPAQWRTLWPFFWDGEALSTRRDEVDSTTWNLVYMQQQVAEDATFPEEAVTACKYAGTVGPLSDRVRPGGMEGLYVVAGLDPAGAGYTAIIVLGIDRKTKRRYVLDAINRRGMTPLQLRQHVASVCERYRPREWRIEKNGLQTHISQDPELRQLIMNTGGRIVEHHTNTNKWDPSFGVMSLAPLFLGALETPPNPLILIPDNGHHKGIMALLDQLITWEPETKSKTDLVMALWFADLGCRKWIDGVGQKTHVDNKWTNRQQYSSRRVINLDEYYSPPPAPGEAVVW